MTTDDSNHVLDLHDSDGPMSWLHAVEVVGRALNPQCQHCNATPQPLPMPGNGWALDVTHEPTCPTHEDNRGTAVLHRDHDGRLTRRDAEA